MAKKRQKLPDCLNCKTALPEDHNFCPKCGQENDQKIKSVYSYLDDSFHDWFAFDNRLWRSIVPFLFRPAYLTKAYCQGRRQDFITPLRLYLTVSVLCFFAISLLIGEATSTQDNMNKKLNELETKPKKKEEKQAKKDSLAKKDVSNTKIVLDIKDTLNKKDTLGKKNVEKKKKKKSSKLAIEFDEDDDFSFFGEKLPIKDYEKAKKILDSKTLSRQQKMDSLHLPNTFWKYTLVKQKVRIVQSTPMELTNYIMNKLPIVMFFLLPFFAWLLHIFYLFSKRKYYYVESLVFTLHTHSFVFFTFFIALLVTYFNIGAKADFIGAMWGWLVLINMVYIFAAQKRFYGQGYFWTFVKYSIYSFIYVITLFTGLLIGMLLTVFFFY